jgi:hypothetical protein
MTPDPDYARALIQARCPELTDADLAALGPPADLPAEIGEAIFHLVLQPCALP